MKADYGYDFDESFEEDLLRKQKIKKILIIVLISIVALFVIFTVVACIFGQPPEAGDSRQLIQNDFSNINISDYYQ